MFVDPEIGAGGAQRAARTRNKAKTIFLFKSARPLGVPAFVMDRRISARLNAAACNNTRLATARIFSTWASSEIPFSDCFAVETPPGGRYSHDGRTHSNRLSALLHSAGTSC